MSKKRKTELVIVPKTGQEHTLKSLEWVGVAPIAKPPGRPWGLQGVGANPDDSTDEVPGRFMRVTADENPLIARKRWQETKVWRMEDNVDWILEEPQPSYFLFKHCYRHYYHRQSRTGEFMYIEQPGIDSKVTQNLWDSGFEVRQMARHYIFLTEFLWRVADPDDDKMIISVFDMAGCSLNQLRGTPLQLFRECTQLVALHYPDRCRAMYLINCPWWFKQAWAIMRPWVDPRTADKVHFCYGKSDYLPRLGEYFDMDSIPAELGGDDPTPLGEAPIEVLLRNHVAKVNGRHGYPTSIDDGYEEGNFLDLFTGKDTKSIKTKWTPPAEWISAVNAGTYSVKVPEKMRHDVSELGLPKPVSELFFSCSTTSGSAEGES